jgi:hypothetical protein
MPGLGDEAPELAIRHAASVYPEAVDRHAMNGTFLSVKTLVAHAELASLDPCHLARPGHP